jgi:hypothetical protein
MYLSPFIVLLILLHSEKTRIQISTVIFAKEDELERLYNFDTFKILTLQNWG